MPKLVRTTHLPEDATPTPVFEKFENPPRHPTRERKPHVLQAFQLMATSRYTLETLLEEVTAAGFRSRPTKRFPQGGPLGIETLRRMLRSRYYIGWVEVDGIEYRGRHETFISEELFERVQRVLDAHQGAGVRERKHPHYLKGWLWCGRCGQRFLIQKATGRRGGEYYYFFCIGRQDKTCDHPYVPMEIVEDAIAAYYRTDVHLSAEFLAHIRAMLDEATEEDFSLSTERRDQFVARLAVLEKKESYYLDLAAEEGWPRDKLRDHLRAIRTEREDIRRSLTATEDRLNVGKAVFHSALDLLAAPGDAYAEGNELVKTALNKALFSKFLIDGTKVVGHEMKEPFDSITEVHERQKRRTYQRTSGGLQLAEPTEAELAAWAFDLSAYDKRSGGKRGGRGQVAERGASKGPVHQVANGASDLAIADLLDLGLYLQVQGSSKTVVVRRQGPEPRTH